MTKQMIHTRISKNGKRFKAGRRAIILDYEPKCPECKVRSPLPEWKAHPLKRLPGWFLCPNCGEEVRLGYI